MGLGRWPRDSIGAWGRRPGNSTQKAEHGLGPVAPGQHWSWVPSPSCLGNLHRRPSTTAPGAGARTDMDRCTANPHGEPKRSYENDLGMSSATNSLL